MPRLLPGKGQTYTKVLEVLGFDVMRLLHVKSGRKAVGPLKPAADPVRYIDADTRESESFFSCCASAASGDFAPEEATGAAAAAAANDDIEEEALLCFAPPR